ncbi:MAG TPA: helicase-related protein [Azospirillaceae bacterium]|nr:helicase-related protein [Azospirillaceae bacterium]
MSTLSSLGGRVVAVLGPTNTGKTFLAIERMLAHASGMIGFPLRLLARENYDKVVKAKGKRLVALVTGEEKIIPPQAQYWICTVESMPLEKPVQFLAIDEIQLAADPERGHIFTDRLLHARGTQETMFLGSETIRPVLQKLVPKAEYVSRPRFSNLSYAGHRKLGKLPPRSAIVAFSATDVYGIAEMVRRSRGGTAVVLGALSPRTRNAQVAMYQAGEVDYLVATDAIGMGLNMDVDHVAFARLSKFDGHQPRRLYPQEVAQIAGRAGRHLTDGTFGTTHESSPMDEELVEAVENHRFDPVKHVMWRNSDLNFRSLGLLLKSLEYRPQHAELIRARDADDHRALQILAKDDDIVRITTNPGAVRLLWEVCQIPDFRKVLSDSHTRMLGQIYRHLMAGFGRLPEEWVAAQVAKLDRVEGDIDALVTRIAHVRTWTYIAHRQGWLPDPVHWQERTRAIEDKLSDALHERLTQRFVDKRSAGLVRSLRGGKEILGSVSQGGTVMVEGHQVGALEGLRFTMDEDVSLEDSRPVMTAARKALGGEIGNRVRLLEQAPDAEFTLEPDGHLLWQGAPVAVLATGPSVLAPLVRPVHDDLLDAAQRERLKARLAKWLEAHVADRLAPLLALKTADLSGPARGIAFQVAEALGALPRATVEPLIATLTKEQRQGLYKAGLRLGFSHVFLPALMKPKAVALRALLWAVHNGHKLPAPAPPAGRTSVPALALTGGGDYPPGFLEAVGFPRVGPRAVRVDILDRIERELMTRSKAGPLTNVGDLGPLLGCSQEEIAGVMAALGWRWAPEQGDKPAAWLRRPPKRPKPARVAADSPFSVLQRIAGGR